MDSAKMSFCLRCCVSTYTTAVYAMHDDQYVRTIFLRYASYLSNPS